MTSENPVRRKVLLITRNLPPLVGGMERFNERVVAQLSRHFEVAVCGPEDCEKFLPMGTKVATSPVRPLSMFLIRTAFSSLRMARRFRPDVVIAGSGLTAPLALLVARRRKVRALVFLYGLDLVVPSILYQSLWLAAIRRCDGYLPISRHTRELAIAKGASADRMEIVNPGVDPDLGGISDGANFRASHELRNRPVLLSVGRLTRRKGLVEFVENCMPAIVSRYPDVALVVIGGEPSNALAGNRGGVTAQVRAVAKSLHIERNVCLLGSVADDSVRAAYHASQVHVFPVLDIPGDVEGFGIVALEAAAAGVPTVAFSVGGVPDAIEHGVSGALVETGNYQALTNAILSCLEPMESGARDVRQGACKKFARNFEWGTIGERMNRAVSKLAGFEV